jgi:NAD(P)-dependent dehydrogenase (short-subunit alcohol dehydrogenase family)
MENRNILITGVSRGIGLETSRRFLAEGHKVVGIGRNPPEESILNNPLFTFLKCDLAIQTERESLKSQLKDLSIDLFIHSAMPSLPHGPHISTDQSEMRLAFEIGVNAPLEIITMIGKKMRSNQFGRIIFLGSAVQLTGSSGQTPYLTIKSAQEGLMKSLCAELSPYGITVNQLLLGLVLTPGLIQNTSEEQRESILNLVPVKKYVDYDQIFGFLKFILQKNSSPLNGAMIPFSYGAQWRTIK